MRHEARISRHCWPPTTGVAKEDVSETGLNAISTKYAKKLIYVDRGAAGLGLVQLAQPLEDRRKQLESDGRHQHAGSNVAAEAGAAHARQQPANALRRGGSADRGGLDDHGDDGWMQVGKHGKPASVSVSPLRIRSIMPISHVSAAWRWR
jgi:hypothetical protein